ncbi:alpha-2,8-sialyltransferase 8E-like [Maylandia zebra]|uniref:alpha-2,8-sialyltransferase 8E-like n=1 Tax=Maylandia zebra TaxID=106582 RepID=UPI00403C9355
MGTPVILKIILTDGTCQRLTLSYGPPESIEDLIVEVKRQLQLSINCNGSNNAIVTRENTPVGSKIVCDRDRTVIPVTPELFKILIKENPFSKKRWDTCSVVGSGGILTNSGCGKTIDSTDFVIRCNLPPLENEFKSDVGMKTNLVTANPSILTKKYGSLMARRRAFVDSLHQYGNSLLLFPCFSSGGTRAVCQRAVYAIEDMEIPIQPIFTNPQYLQSMDQFWNSQGVKGLRASTGAYMISLALELCETVHLYGFWPFSNHPYKLFPLTNHYYDNVPYNSRIHAMSDEFYYWVQLHNKGILKLHLEDCKSGQV